MPNTPEHFVVLWKSYSQNPSNLELSIPSWIAKNQVFVRRQYLSWVRQSYQYLKSNTGLYEEMQLDSIINYFQLTPFMEMNLFAKSPQITSILKLIAFESWIDKKSLVSIEYVGDDEILSMIFQEYTERKQISFVSSFPSTSKTKVIHNLVRLSRFCFSYVKSPLWIFLKWINSFPLHGSNIDHWKLSGSGLTFYSYYAHFSPSSASRAEFESSYWGELPRYLQSIEKNSNWIHLSPTNDGILASLHKRFILKKWSGGKRTQTHVALESFFNAKILIRTISKWLKIRSHAQSIEQFMFSHRTRNFDFWRYYYAEFESYLSGIGLIDTILTFELVKSSVQSKPTSQKTFYLYEGQPWEKVLNSVSDYLDHEFPIAVQHSTVRFWDLRYFQHELELPIGHTLEALFPKQIVVNGELAYRMLGYRPSQQELIILESLRYSPSPSKCRNSQEISKRFSPVILGSYLSDENEFILRLLEDVAASLTDIEFTFKPHPLSTKPFVSNTVAIKSSRKELSHVLNEATHVLIGSSTSAVIEVIKSQIPFGVFVPPSTINLCPLNGFARTKFLTNSSELLDFLTKTNEEFQNGLHFVDLVTTNSNLELWKCFLNQTERVGLD